MKSKHNHFTCVSAFGSVATLMFGAIVVNELFGKTEQNQSSLPPLILINPVKYLCRLFKRSLY
jgi:hypothetical protein